MVQKTGAGHGDYTFDALSRICRRVDAAVFVFGEDDRVWYRGDKGAQPRDNVLIEFGLLVGVLGRHRAIVCRVGKPRLAVDLAGLTVVDGSRNVSKRAKLEVVRWAKNLSANDDLDGLGEPKIGRQAKLIGRWEGNFEQPEYPGGALALEARVEFARSVGHIKGRAQVRTRLSKRHRGGPREVTVNLALSGRLPHSDFLKLEYQSVDPGVNQFGSMMLELNAEGTRLNGRFVGYGSISEAIISGTVALKKLSDK